MEKKIILMIMVIALLIGCAKQDVEQTDQIDEGRFYSTHLPTFEQTFAALDYLQRADFDTAIDREIYTVIPDVFRRAFALGVLSADGVIAVKARNKAALREITVNMIDYSKFIGISQEILQLSDELLEMIEKDQWSELKTALDKYKEKVEFSLYEKKEYDLFTMLQLGGWTEGLNRISFLLLANYDQDSSRIIDQKGVLNQLIHNVSSIENPLILDQEYFKLSLENYNLIRDIIYNDKGYYNIEEINQIFSLTQEIKEAFQN